MMENQQIEKVTFDRVLSRKNVFAIAFGAMIGWGWVVMAGQWIRQAGTLGAITAFIAGGHLFNIILETFKVFDRRIGKLLAVSDNTYLSVSAYRAARYDRTGDRTYA